MELVINGFFYGISIDVHTSSLGPDWNTLEVLFVSNCQAIIFVWIQKIASLKFELTNFWNLNVQTYMNLININFQHDTAEMFFFFKFFLIWLKINYDILHRVIIKKFTSSTQPFENKSVFYFYVLSFSMNYYFCLWSSLLFT